MLSGGSGCEHRPLIQSYSLHNILILITCYIMLEYNIHFEQCTIYFHALPYPSQKVKANKIVEKSAVSTELGNHWYYLPMQTILCMRK